SARFPDASRNRIHRRTKDRFVQPANAIARQVPREVSAQISRRKLYGEQKAKSIGTGGRKSAGRKAEFRKETERDECQPWWRKRSSDRSQQARTVEIEEQARAMNQSAA